MKYEFKGTKGRWQTDEMQSMVVDEHGRCIAEVYCPSELHPEMQDNCKLLAAAPELLAACIEFLRVSDIAQDITFAPLYKRMEYVIDKALTTPVKGE